MISLMKTRSFWNELSSEQKDDADLVQKWDRQRQPRKNYVSVKDILQRMLKRSKSSEIVGSLPHAKFGTISEDREKIEVSERKKERGFCSKNER